MAPHDTPHSRPFLNFQVGMLAILGRDHDEAITAVGRLFRDRVQEVAASA